MRIGKQHVLERGELRQQKMELEDEAAGFEPQVGFLRLGEAGRRLPVHEYLPFGRAIEEAEQIEQGGFPRP